MTPDMCVAAFVYLASGVVIRIRAGEGSWALFSLLGVVLGMGYLAKAAMFPLAFVFLMTSLFAAGSLRRALPRTLLGLAVFFLVGGPYMLALSRVKGRFTFGESGRLNYAEFVSGVTRFIHWQGQGRGTGTPKHPTPQISDLPPAYEFATPVGGTYPPWYDQSYWYEGVIARFDLKGQLMALSETGYEYSVMLGDQEGLLVGLLAFFLLGYRGWPSWIRLARQWHLTGPALAALTMYALVCVKSRYVPSFIVLLWMGLFSGVDLPNSTRIRKATRCVAIAMVVAIALLSARAIARDLVYGMNHPGHLQWEIARFLYA